MRPVLAFLYHDPRNRYGDALVRNFSVLQDNFAKVCICVTPITRAQNSTTIDTLRRVGFVIVDASGDTDLGENHRLAMRLAVSQASHGQSIYFGYIDRILFALLTHHKDTFLADVTNGYDEDFVLFSRSEKAWQTHPAEYRLLEQGLNLTAEAFVYQRFDWIWCGALMKHRLMTELVARSKHTGVSVLAEVLYLAHTDGHAVKNIFVDWLEWEDPFWDAKVSADKPLTEDEKQFRLSYCIEAEKLFIK